MSSQRSRWDELDRDIALALAKRAATDPAGSSYTAARRLQREGKALRKRYLSPASNAGEIAKRDAVSYADGCGWSNPMPRADEAAKERWGKRWLGFYDVAVSQGGLGPT